MLQGVPAVLKAAMRSLPIAAAWRRRASCDAWRQERDTWLLSPDAVVEWQAHPTSIRCAFLSARTWRSMRTPSVKYVSTTSPRHQCRPQRSMPASVFGSGPAWESNRDRGGRTGDIARLFLARIVGTAVTAYAIPWARWRWVSPGVSRALPVWNPAATAELPGGRLRHRW